MSGEQIADFKAEIAALKIANLALVQKAEQAEKRVKAWEDADNKYDKVKKEQIKDLTAQLEEAKKQAEFDNRMSGESTVSASRKIDELRSHNALLREALNKIYDVPTSLPEFNGDYLGFVCEMRERAKNALSKSRQGEV